MNAALQRGAGETSALDVERIRADFPALEPDRDGRRLAFFDSAASTLKPRPVIDRLADFYLRRYANVHRGVYALSQEATRAYEDARVAVQRFLGARDASEIVFVRGTTEAINLVASTFGRQRIGRDLVDGDCGQFVADPRPCAAAVRAHIRQTRRIRRLQGVDCGKVIRCSGSDHAQIARRVYHGFLHGVTAFAAKIGRICD